MRPSTTLNRALAHMTVDTHRKIMVREEADQYYKLTECEQQYQCPISGTLGTLPVEVTVKILFSIQFLWDAGVLRDSQLGEPMYRGGVHLSSAPSGTMTYTHVSSWVQDDSFNYVGANVVVGVHNPAMSIAGATVPTDTSFQGILHCAFQGFGAPLDNDDMMVIS
jgi:hypothetical protein